MRCSIILIKHVLIYPQSWCVDYFLPGIQLGDYNSSTSLSQVDRIMLSRLPDSAYCCRDWNVRCCRCVTICFWNALRRSESHPIVNCWDGVLWLDTYKRTVIYTVVAVLLFAQPHRPWFSTMAGLCLILLALLHAARWYKALRLDNQTSLLLQQDDLDDDGGYTNKQLLFINDWVIIV